MHKWWGERKSTRKKHTRTHTQEPKSKITHKGKSKHKFTVRPLMQTKHVCRKETKLHQKEKSVKPTLSFDNSCAKQHPRSSSLSLSFSLSILSHTHTHTDTYTHTHTHTHTHTWRRVSAEHVLCISVCVRAAGCRDLLLWWRRRRKETREETARREFKWDEQKRRGRTGQSQRGCREKRVGRQEREPQSGRERNSGCHVSRW